MKDSVSTLMRAWPGLELSIILPGRGSIEEMATDTIGWIETMSVFCMASVLQTERPRLSKSQVDPKRIDNGSSFFFYSPTTKQPTRLRVSCYF